MGQQQQQQQQLGLRTISCTVLVSFECMYSCTCRRDICWPRVSSSRRHVLTTGFYPRQYLFETVYTCTSTRTVLELAFLEEAPHARIVDRPSTALCMKRCGRVYGDDRTWINAYRVGRTSHRSCVVMMQQKIVVVKELWFNGSPSRP